MSSCLQDSILSQTLTLQSITDWINETNKSEEVSLGSDSSFISFLKSLKDGVALCKLVSKLKGRFIMFNKNPRNMEFMEQENFETFIKVCILYQMVRYISRPKIDHNVKILMMIDQNGEID